MMYKMYHPELDKTIHVPSGAVRVHERSGWIDADQQDDVEPDPEPEPDPVPELDEDVED